MAHPLTRRAQIASEATRSIRSCSSVALWSSMLVLLLRVACPEPRPDHRGDHESEDPDQGNHDQTESRKQSRHPRTAPEVASAVNLADGVHFRS